MMNIQKLLQDVFFLLIIKQNIKKKKSVYIVKKDFFKQEMNLVYIVRQEKMEVQIVKNVNILNQMKLNVKNVKKIVLKLQMEDASIV